MAQSIWWNKGQSQGLTHPTHTKLVSLCKHNAHGNIAAIEHLQHQYRMGQWPSIAKFHLGSTSSSLCPFYVLSLSQVLHVILLLIFVSETWSIKSESMAHSSYSCSGVQTFFIHIDWCYYFFVSIFVYLSSHSLSWGNILSRVMTLYSGTSITISWLCGTRVLTFPLALHYSLYLCMLCLSPWYSISLHPSIFLSGSL